MKGIKFIICFYFSLFLNFNAVFAECKKINEAEFNSLLQEKKPIELIFFSSWCSDCKDDLIKLADSTNILKNNIIIINTFDRPEKGYLALKVLNIDYPCYFDNDKKLTKKYNIKSVPAHIIIK